MKILYDVGFVLLFACLLTAFLLFQIFLIGVCTSGKLGSCEAITLFVFVESLIIGVIVRVASR